MDSADGFGGVNLTNDAATDLSPAWSPDGTKIAFTSDRAAGESAAIYTMNADGSNPARITVPRPDDLFEAEDLNPDWQPVGSAAALPAARRRVSAQRCARAGLRALRSGDGQLDARAAADGALLRTARVEVPASDDLHHRPGVGIGTARRSARRRRDTRRRGGLRDQAQPQRCPQRRRRLGLRGLACCCARTFASPTTPAASAASPPRSTTRIFRCRSPASRTPCRPDRRAPSTPRPTRWCPA